MADTNNIEVVDFTWRSADFTATGRAEYHGTLAVKVTDPFTQEQKWRIDDRGARTPEQLEEAGFDLAIIISGFNAAVAKENDTNKSAIADLTASLADTQAKLQSTSDDLSQRNKDVSDRDESISSLHSQVNQAQQDIAARDATIADLQKQLQEATNASNDLTAQLTQVTQTVADRDVTITGLNAQVSSLNDQVTKLSTANAPVDGEDASTEAPAPST